jgi:hypothetical protein
VQPTGNILTDGTRGGESRQANLTDKSMQTPRIYQTQGIDLSHTSDLVGEDFFDICRASRPR